MQHRGLANSQMIVFTANANTKSRIVFCLLFFCGMSRHRELAVNFSRASMDYSACIGAVACEAYGRQIAHSSGGRTF